MELNRCELVSVKLDRDKRLITLVQQALQPHRFFNDDPSVKISNRVTEKDVRLWLDDQGWAGRSAKIEQLDLHAIKSPGWIQIFRFVVSVKPAIKSDEDEELLESRSSDARVASTEPQTFYGVVRDDERQKSSPTKIWMYEDQDEQKEKLSELSEGLITLRNGETSTGFLLVSGIFAGLVSFAFLLRWFAS